MKGPLGTKSRGPSGRIHVVWFHGRSWVQVPVLPLTSWVVFGKSFSLAEPLLSHLESGAVVRIGVGEAPADLEAQ